ncbi:MAG: hypothetical protein LBL83_06410 [Clostridiales bacterium]|nr:hypothetical protein [Clostridiales bacterium]
MKKKRADENVVYKTEEMLKQEALKRVAEEARIEAAQPPLSPKRKKWDNYWYHYKWHTIGGAALAVLVIYFVQSVVFQVKPDITIVFASSAYVPQESIDALCAAVESGISDRNGDGKVLVQADFTYLPTVPGADVQGADGAGGADAAGGADSADAADGAGSGSAGDQAWAGAEAGAGAAAGTGAEAEADIFAGGMAADPQMEQASIMKLMAVTAAGADPLYLVDDALYNYFARMAAPTEYDGEGQPLPSDGGDIEQYSMFEPLDGVAGASGPLGDRLPLEATSLFGEPGCEQLGGFSFALRPPSNGKDETVSYQSFCLEMLKSVATG